MRSLSIKKSMIRSVSIVLVTALLCVGSQSVKTLEAVPVNPFLTYTPQQDIDEARRDRDEARQAAEEASEMIDQLSEEREHLTGELSKLQGLSDEQMAQYELIAQQYAAALIAKQEALDAYITSQEALEQKRLQYSERISIMFEYQNKSTLEILLESDSLAGFFTNIEIIALIGDADQQIMDEMQIALDDAELQTEIALQEAEDMQTIAEEKQAQLAELEARIGVTQDALDLAESQLSSWQQKEDEFLDEAERLDDEIARLQRQLDQSRNPSSGGSGTTSPAPSGTMTWPYPGDYTVYSPFGNRYHPVYHVYKMHWGVDLGGVYGNPIVAAADGTVILVSEPVEGQNTGGTNYGNYCVIDHGDGISTLYGHCRDVYVHTGDTVTAGQTIAECGSTGTSTGAHVHFEVRVNGTKVDPLPYIQG